MLKQVLLLLLFVVVVLFGVCFYRFQFLNFENEDVTLETFPVRQLDSKRTKSVPK